MTETQLQSLIANLPEVYQVIYGHPEWNSEAARDCKARFAVINDVCQRLSQHLNRPLKILDLGCAQGFFSLSLAHSGATVTGVDFQAENIAVCSALAEENPDLQVNFVQGRIEDWVGKLELDEYDVVLGLSVFHHLVYLYGEDQVRGILLTLMNAINVGIFEFALKEEPLYWGNAQPDDPRYLIDGCAFYHQMGSHETHLSSIRRPMYFVSNRTLLFDKFCGKFDNWRTQPHPDAGNAHSGSRRYYWGEGFFGKVMDFTSVREPFPSAVVPRNKTELRSEAIFLSQKPDGFSAPQLLTHGENDQQGWIVTSAIDGGLLSEMINVGAPVDVDCVLKDVLQQAVTLESVGLYHDDIRLWNVMYDRMKQRFSLIDYGSIGTQTKDIGWPHNLFQAFFIFVHELLMPDLARIGEVRAPLLSPFHLPYPYSSWLYAFWQKPISEWSFSLLATLFEQRLALPQPANYVHGVQAWLRAYELHILERLHRESDLRKRMEILNTNGSEVMESLSRTQAGLFEQSKIIGAQEERLRALSEQGRSQEDRLRVLTNRCTAYGETLQAVYSSRSWRLTAPYRYLGMQVALLRKYGIKQRCKHLLKRLFKLAVRMASRYPTMRYLTFRVLRFTGLYSYVRQIHRRIMPVESPSADTTDHFQRQIIDQLADRKLLPPVVNDIFDKLSR